MSEEEVYEFLKSEYAEAPTCIHCLAKPLRGKVNEKIIRTQVEKLQRYLIEEGGE